MSEIAISAEGLGKKYRLGANAQPYKTLRESLTGAAGVPLRVASRLARRRVSEGARGYRPEFWALRDVSFQVKHGDVLGVIGRNGAGKSTLLKLLSQITEPTEGLIRIEGRVASLLEVGTGFHPELTGRENVYLNGAILGMSRADIARKFDEIVAFAEVERFIDTQVKHYSSGMYLRLAFAVAAHLEPETLVVDEVLAVGDATFQKKCLGKMSDVAGEGRTVIFVSHNMTAMETMCRRVMWLQSGRLVEDGPATHVISHYLKTSYATQNEQVWDDIADAPGNETVRLRRVCIRPEDGAPSDLITVRTPLVLECDYWNLEPDAYLNLSLHVFNEEGTRIFNTAPVREPVWHGRAFPTGLFRSVCHIPGDLLNDGRHSVQLLVVKNQAFTIFSQDDALIFDVSDTGEGRGDYHGKWQGAVRPYLEWSTQRLQDAPPMAPTPAGDAAGVAR